MISYEEILVEFQKQKVKYVIVGGMAVNLHGYLRATADLDVLVDMTAEIGPFEHIGDFRP